MLYSAVSHPPAIFVAASIRYSVLDHGGANNLVLPNEHNTEPFACGAMPGLKVTSLSSSRATGGLVKTIKLLGRIGFF